LTASRILSFGEGAPEIMSAIGRHVSKLTGYAPALPTPFGAEGDIDIPAFEQLCDLQLAHGATALVVCGTTGEAPTLTPEEHRLLIQIAAAQTRGRIPVIAGAGANATAHAIELSRDAEAAGADAVLSVVPYYNKCRPVVTKSAFIAFLSPVYLATLRYRL
jgi:4-hydroxy-tetrahydrodipicolinate synthase